MARTLVLATVLLALAGQTFAQVPTATLYGYVQDASGAAVPDATVGAKSEQTGVELTATTDARGEFTFNAVQPGTYTVSVEAARFKRLDRANIQLSPGDRLRVPLQLEVGTVSERVTVTAEAPLLSTSTSEQRNTFNTLQLTDLPVSNRDWTSLLSLGTGVQRRGDGVSLNGFGSATFNFTVDGTNASGTQEYSGFGQFGGFNTIKPSVSKPFPRFRYPKVSRRPKSEIPWRETSTFSRKAGQTSSTAPSFTTFDRAR